MPLAEFDAIAMQFGAILGRHYELEADAVTSNLIIFAVTSVLVINPDVHESLSDDHQAALRSAAAEALPSMMASITGEEDAARETLCATGLTFALASDDQLAAPRRPAAGLRRHRRQPGNAEVLDEITALKEDLAVPPDGPTCPETPPSRPTAMQPTPPPTSP